MRKFTRILFLVAVAFFLTGCVGPQKTADTEQSKERGDRNTGNHCV